MQVKVWFQNRRTKHKRTTTEDEASVTSQQDDGDTSSSAIHEHDMDNDHAQSMGRRESETYDSEKDSSFSDDELPVDVGT